MKVVYVAGKYSGKTRQEIENNIYVAELCAITLANMGIAFICPHLNSQGFEYKSSADYEFYMQMYLSIIPKCDAVIMLPNYRESKGAMREMELALKNNIQLFMPHTPTDIECFEEVKDYFAQ